MDSSSATFLRLRTLIGTYLTNPPYRFIYDSAGHLVGEYDSNNALRQETVWLGDMPVALIQKNAEGVLQVNYLLVDHLNTPRVVLSTTNIPIWRWDNADPFGNAAPNQDPDGDGNKVEMNLRFPGQYYDAETGLFYNYFRDYNPATGRYIASDPIGLDGGLNTYTYVGGNPVNESDPTGLIKHSTGQTKQCGNCTIRIDTVLDEKTGTITRHLHWECKGNSGVGGENGTVSDGSTCANAPKNVKACAAALGFQCDAPPITPPDALMCSNNCTLVPKPVIDFITGATVIIWVCAATLIAP